MQSVNGKIILAAAIGILAFSPLLAFAQAADQSCGLDVFCHMTKFLNWGSLQLGYVISYFAAFLISFAGSLIQILVNLSASVASNPLVQEGFKITLSLANLGFVLAIIIIAFATMLRVERYGMKAMIRNLVIAALLVNFSFAIAGVFIDFTNILGNFFISAATPENNTATFADNLANSLSIQKISGIVQKAEGGEGGGILKFGTSYLQAFASLAFTAIFNVALVITFFAIAFFLLVRYLFLTFLLIVMPIVWLFWIFPDLSGNWGKWWSNFLKWNFFYPAVSFFLYLSILTSQKLGTMVTSGAANSTGIVSGTASLLGLDSTAITAFMQILVQIGILAGGLFVAQSMGLYGANAFMGAAKGTSGWIKGAAGRLTGVPALGRGIKGAGAAAGGYAGTKLLSSERWKGVAGAMSKVPGLRGVAAGMYNLSEAPRARVADAQKEIAGKYVNREALVTASKMFTTDPARKAAFANELAKRGMGDLADESLLSAAKSLGANKDILENAPHLASKVMTPAQVIKLLGVEKDDEKAKIMEDEAVFEERALEAAMSTFKPSKTDELKPEVIEKVAKYFGQGHRERLAKEGSSGQLLAALKGAERISASGDKEHELVKFAINNPAMQRVIFSPEYSGALKTLGADIKLAEAAKKAAEEATQKMTGEAAKKTQEETKKVVEEAVRKAQEEYGRQSGIRRPGQRS